MNIFKIILVLAYSLPVFLLIPLSSLAADATFSWTPNDPAPSGYKIYYGMKSRNYDKVIDVGLPEVVDETIVASVPGLADGQTYHFAATAYTGSEESSYSEEAVYTTPGTPSLALEIGEVSVSSERVPVSFTENFINPVVIANAITRNNASPVVVNVSNVTSSGFDIQLEEYDYQDKIHEVEIVNYIAIEQGSYILEDGTSLEAGLIAANAAKFEKTRFMKKFKSKPIVLTSINSKNYPETVTSRIKNVTRAGFKVKLQEQEVNKKDHGAETVSYLALSKGSRVTNGIHFLAGKTKKKVNQKTYNINLTEQFNELPYHFCTMQTAYGKETSSLRIVQAGLDSMDVMVEEETSKDLEVKHPKEKAGFLVIAAE